MRGDVLIDPLRIRDGVGKRQLELPPHAVVRPLSSFACFIASWIAVAWASRARSAVSLAIRAWTAVARTSDGACPSTAPITRMEVPLPANQLPTVLLKSWSVTSGQPARSRMAFQLELTPLKEAPRRPGKTCGLWSWRGSSLSIETAGGGQVGHSGLSGLRIWDPQLGAV